MKRPRLCLEDYTVGWVCALPVELAAARMVLDEEHEELIQDLYETNIYTLGRIGNHNVVISCLPAGQTGTSSAAAVAVQMDAKFTSIRVRLMVGVGGGVPNTKNDIRLGDVVISQPDQGHGGVAQYDFGKDTASGFVRTGYLNPPPKILLNALARMRANSMIGQGNLAKHMSVFGRLESFSRPEAKSDILFDAAYQHRGQVCCGSCDRIHTIKREPRQEITTHYGTIASGNHVIKNGVVRDRLSTDLGGVLCFEMEAAGLMNDFPCIVIRGICDYSDSHKNKDWQPYAAAVAAACAKEVLSVLPLSAEPRNEERETTVIYESLRSAIGTMGLVDLQPALSVLDQDDGISQIRQPAVGNPAFHWCFRNIDFRRWADNQNGSVLWISAPNEIQVHQITSYVLDQARGGPVEPDHLILSFFCSLSSKAGSRATMVALFHTLLHQILRFSPLDQKEDLIRTFFATLLQTTFSTNAWRERDFKSNDPPRRNLRKLASAPAQALILALNAVLDICCPASVSLFLDGIDQVGDKEGEFFPSIRRLVDKLLQRASRFNSLLTSRPLHEIRQNLHGLLCIDYDTERQECLTSLRFDNTRLGKISEEYSGSCEWLWKHRQYREWSASDSSRLLLVEGKPGSGKSTVTKYFSRNVLGQKPDFEGSIMAKFFYSYREGALQRSHYNMLRVILHDILSQDMAFFYHHIQRIYRAQHRRQHVAEWDYTALQEALRSLCDYQPGKQVFMIIDAVDESDEVDRRHILNLLIELCSRTKYFALKIFVASRPVTQLELRRKQFHNFIRLQDETKSDILHFTHGVLDGLHLPHVLVHVVDYIVKHADGVFLWVKLVVDELWDRVAKGDAEEDIVDFLEGLPTDLEQLYKLMLDRLDSGSDDMQSRKKLFQFVLFACRPFTVEELLHSLALRDVDVIASEEAFRRRIPLEQAIVHYGDNFLEVRTHNENRVVQVMHQTVREFLLMPSGYAAEKGLKLSEQEAHLYITTTCLRYLLLCTARAGLPEHLLSSFEGWSSFQLTSFLQYLSGWPLLTYAVQYLSVHIGVCRGEKIVNVLASSLHDQLINHPSNPFKGLLGRWIQMNMGRSTSHHPGHFCQRVFRAATLEGYPTAAHLALIAGAEPDRHNAGRTPLSLAAEAGHKSIVYLLADRDDVGIDAGDFNGRTPFSWAASAGREDIVLLLMNRRDVRVNSEDKTGRTPLSWAASSGCDGVVQLLVNQVNANINSKDSDERTPLAWAAATGHESVVQLLMKLPKINLNSPDKYLRSPLSLAAENGHLQVARLLAEDPGVDVNLQDKYGQTPLWWAAWSGHLEVVKLLTELPHTIVTTTDDQGRTPLLWAAQRGHEAVVQLLVTRHEQMTNAEDDSGRTPISWAAESGNTSVVRFLAHRPDFLVDQRDKSGWTPLCYACSAGHIEIAHLLINHLHACPDPRTRSGRTPLSLAADNGHEEIVQMLIQRDDVNPDSRDRAGRTPLSWAAGSGKIAVVQVLAECRGVDILSRDRNHMTAAQYAAKAGFPEIFQFLERSRGVHGWRLQRQSHGSTSFSRNQSGQVGDRYTLSRGAGPRW